MLTDTARNPDVDLPMDGASDADAPRKAKARLLTLGDLDGRTRAAQMVAQSIDSIECDLGKDLTAAERAIVRRAAIAGAMCESMAASWLTGDESVDPAAFATLANLERRQLETVGIKRRARNVTPSIRDHVRAKAAGGAG